MSDLYLGDSKCDMPDGGIAYRRLHVRWWYYIQSVTFRGIFRHVARVLEQSTIQHREDTAKCHAQLAASRQAGTKC